jgi:gas vesicle protein
MNDRTLCFVLGVSAGMGFGLLFAPRAGKATRTLIQRRVNSEAARLRKQTAEIGDKVADFVDRGRSAVSQQTQGVVAAVNAGKKAYHAVAHR